MPTHTGTVRGSAIELDDGPGLPDGRRVRVVVEPVESADPAGSVDPNNSLPGSGGRAVDPRPGIEQVAGRWAEYGEELEAHVEEMRQLRRLTREEARRLRGGE